MFVPFISELPPRLFRRKGGRGGKGGGGKSGSSGFKIKSGSILTGSTPRNTVAYGEAYVRPKLIPVGRPFAGRMEGGGTRNGIFGTQIYGSGYPDPEPPSVSGRGFPYFFWPIVWIPVVAVSIVKNLHYLDSEQEYGSPTNSSRPGGPLAYATFPSSSSPTVVFRILADNFTIASLIPDLTKNCSTYLSDSSAPPNSLSTTPTPYAPPYTFDNATGPANPRPEQAIQYYRASSLVLTMDSYNNTAIYSDENTPDTPGLPALEQNDAKLLECLNITIGLAAPLVSAGRQTAKMNIPFFVLWVIWCFFL